jgi:hypothetical protein
VDQIRNIPEDVVSEKILKRIFGKAIAKRASLLFDAIDAIDPSMTATNDTLGPREWRANCEDFLKKEEKRDDTITYCAKARQIALQGWRSSTNQADQAFAAETYRSALRLENEQRAISRKNAAARA